MKSRYKVYNQEGIHFVTSPIIEWILVFTDISPKQSFPGDFIPNPEIGNKITSMASLLNSVWERAYAFETLFQATC